MYTTVPGKLHVSTSFRVLISPVGFRQCQKADWPHHKALCGKRRPRPPEPSTVDALRSSLYGPDIVRELIESSRGATLSAIGPGDSHHSRPPALQHQFELAQAHPDVDYFIWDDKGKTHFCRLPPGSPLRLMFRLLRREAMSYPDRRGADAIADALLQYVNNKPGLGPQARETVLNQFCEEYGEDLRTRLARFQRTWSDGPGFLNEVYDLLSTPTHITQAHVLAVGNSNFELRDLAPK